MDPPELNVGDLVSVIQCCGWHPANPIDVGTYRVTLCRVGAVLDTHTGQPLVIAGPPVKSIAERLAEIATHAGYRDTVQITLPPDPEPYYLTIVDGKWTVCTANLDPIPGYLESIPYKATHAHNHP